MIKAIQRWKVKHPGALGHGGRRAAFACLRLTSGLRVLPDFIIIGAQKCGTTSLFNYLSLHPRVLPSIQKEVNYFGENSSRRRGWYRAHFPTALTRRLVQGTSGAAPLVGEASTSYAFHPLAPRQAAQLVPEAKLVLLVRDPVERAISHYHWMRKFDLEPLALEAAFEAEAEQLDASREAWKGSADSGTDWHEPERSYLLRGFYADQLENWKRHFADSRMLVLSAEQMRRDPAATFARTVDFLGLPQWSPEGYDAFNQGSYQPPPESVCQRLRPLFRDPNRRLYEMIEEDLGWE